MFVSLKYKKRLENYYIDLFTLPISSLCDEDIVGSWKILLKLSLCFKIFSKSRQQNTNSNFSIWDFTSFVLAFISVFLRVWSDQSHIFINWLWLSIKKARVSTLIVPTGWTKWMHSFVLVFWNFMQLIKLCVSFWRYFSYDYKFTCIEPWNYNRSKNKIKKILI